MIKIKTLFFGGILLALGFTSCAPRIPFTQEIREQYKLTESEMRQIQFYASHDIVLQRGEQTDKSKATSEGKLTITDSKSVDQVLIKAGTPGVVEKVIGPNKVAVSFENGDGRYLVFGDPFNKKGRYTLLAADWKGNKGELNYAGKTYYVPASGANYYISFKMRKLNQFRKKEHVAKGKKL